MARIDPLPESEWSEDVAPILGAQPPGSDAPLGRLNIFSTLARNPELFKAWMPFGGYLLTAGTLSGRDRELLILRTALNCASPYEWGQHVRISEAGGIDRETIDRVVAGPGADGWSDSESALLRASDELHADAKIGDDTWAELAKSYDEKQLIEIPMVVGQYHMVAFTLNSLGVEQDEGLEDLPAS
jgi:4-carboxymuconolactone decarboxylase